MHMCTKSLVGEIQQKTLCSLFFNFIKNGCIKNLLVNLKDTQEILLLKGSIII